jgi:hypothetical protein
VLFNDWLLLTPERLLEWLLAGLVLVACWLLLLFFCSADRLTAVSLFCFSGSCLVRSLEVLWA